LPTALSSRAGAVFATLASLRVRLTLSVAVLSLVALSGGALLLVRAVESTVLRRIERDNIHELDAFEEQIERGVAADELVLPHGFARLRHPPPGRLPEVLPFPPPGVPAPLMMAVPMQSDSDVPGFGAGWSGAARPVLSPHDGPFVIAVGRPLLEAKRSVDVLRRVLAAGVPGLVLITTVAAWFLIGRTLRPVHAMSRSASRIADATTGERLEIPPTRDEVATLAHTLNGMLDRIADGTRRQREFVSDASHELRSPIAALRTLLEVEGAHPGRTEAKSLHAALLAETSRLETLTADLLALARLDEATPPRRDELDFDDLVLEEAARPRRVAVDTSGVAAAKVLGDRHSLLHLVRNLLDNAARHASTRVAVSIHRDSDNVVLHVDDDGPGIPEADRIRVFDRFTRSDSGRSRDAGGAGLGLAVVERVVQQHGGTARVTDAPGGGARLEIRLPA
jgi:signal transduction histidine kinase